MVLFLVALAAFVGASAWGIFGPDRGEPDGAAAAILDLRLAIATRIAIHGFFIAALFVMGIATDEPVILLVAVVLLVLELPLGALVAQRRQVGVRSTGRPGIVTPA